MAWMSVAKTLHSGSRRLRLDPDSGTPVPPGFSRGARSQCLCSFGLPKETDTQTMSTRLLDSMREWSTEHACRKRGY